ncbi:MAG: helix-turn-helix transcriptional regulator [Clostridia bacterium]
MIKNLPTKLKEQREKYGFSQKEVSKKLNVSTSIISGYETGERTPSIDVLISLSYLYNCSIDFLLGRTETKPNTTINIDGLTNKQVQAIYALVDSIKNK